MAKKKKKKESTPEEKAARRARDEANRLANLAKKKFEWPDGSRIELIQLAGGKWHGALYVGGVDVVAGQQDGPGRCVKLLERKMIDRGENADGS